MPKPATPALPTDHPLRQARWLWPGGFTYLVNSFAQFRKDFTLTKVPKAAPLFITADQHYRLWINGRYVTRGPARGYQTSWPFDEIDVASYLQPGANWLAVEAYNPGISTFQYIHQTAAGLLVAATWGTFTLLSDTTWLARRSKAQRADTARLSLQIDFQEHVDATIDDRSWITSPTAPTGWTNDLKHYMGSGMEAVAFSRPPWDTVEPRGIPQLAEAERPLRRVVSRAAGACAAGWLGWENISWPFVDEGKTATWAAADDGHQADGWLEVPMPASGNDGFTAATIDVGEFVSGCVQIEVDGALGGECVDLHYHEGMQGLRGDLRRPGDACIIALASRLQLKPGRSTHDFFHLLGFGVLTVVARGARQPLTVRLKVRTAVYPFAMRGRFTSSDTTLDAIHTASRRTQQVCAGDAYVDTPWREQAQWWGDARVQAANTFHLDGDARLLARGIRSIAGQRGTAGLTYGHAPTIAYNCILPDFALTWLLTIRDLWWQTGETTMVREMWPRVQDVLNYFDTPEARHTSGLLRHDTRFWLFEDWSDLWKGDVPTFLNLWYLHALRELAGTCAAARMTKEAKELTRRADAHEKLVVRKLFDAKRGCWLAGFDAPLGKESVHDQVIGILLGLKPKAHQRQLDTFVLPYLRGEAVPGPKPSAFWSHYALLAAGDCGYGADGVAFIKRGWTPMLATGTTWEGFEWHENMGGTASHAWTAHPSVHLPRILCGIRQESPAWKRVLIAPQPVTGLDHAETLIPTPQGDLAVSWKRMGEAIVLEVRAPKGMRTDIRLGNQRKLLPNGGKITLRSL